MIADPVTDDRELTEVVFTARDLVPGSSESKRQKTAETLLNILEGRIRNKNTRSAYKAAWFPRYCPAHRRSLRTFHDQDLRQITGPCDDRRDRESFLFTLNSR
jgi:hypothetical protein